MLNLLKDYVVKPVAEKFLGKTSPEKKEVMNHSSTQIRASDHAKVEVHVSNAADKSEISSSLSKSESWSESRHDEVRISPDFEVDKKDEIDKDDDKDEK